MNRCLKSPELIRPKKTSSYDNERALIENAKEYAKEFATMAEERGSMTVVEAGKRGGEKTARTHGHEFFQEIGHKGGKKGGKMVRELIEEGKKAQSTREA